MCRREAAVLLLTPCLLPGVIIDRIAIVIGNSIVKDSDINRDLRVTSFLNGQPLDLGAKARKMTASRLIDQVFIRREIGLGDYPVAAPEEANSELDRLVSERFKSEGALEDSLQRYGITAPDLRSHFLWQLTVLRFIDTRFKPAVLITDQEVEAYYQAHALAFQREHPGKSSLDDVRSEITDALAAKRVDKLFFAWLDDQRKQAKVNYLEANLQ